ncbi:MAG TPA: FAD-dependent oxidoreductase, partial [Gaiellaceae bacterium]|nr:FAD-dependent oxidoreductase [Gaiellaceae bacterium]
MPVSDGASAALAEAEPRLFWLDRDDVPEPASPLEGDAEADLAIVGGGFTGLWAALLAKEAEPAREVVLLEAETCGFGASGRNGGFLEASLTHGLSNGLGHFPGDIDRLLELGRANFAGIAATLERHAIDARFAPVGAIAVATRSHEVEWLRDEAELLREHGEDAVFLDREAVRAEVDSPTYLAGTWQRSNVALVDPGRLAWGLRRAALDLGVRVHERTRVEGIEEAGAGVALAAPGGRVQARRVVLASGVYPPLVREIRRYVAPVYDYVLVTEPLGDRLGALGWRRRQGLADSGNRFHYYRLTDDDRIVWGGYEAVYRFGGPVGSRYDSDDTTHRLLAENFFRTFPQLEGIRFTHRFGGAIDTSSRFCAFFGTKLGGRLAYAAGYTGLGVGATRFGARVALGLVDGTLGDLAELELVRRKPVPYPPEP